MTGNNQKDHRVPLEGLVGRISLTEAAAKGIERLRNPKWVTPEDHIKIDIIDGRLGPWAHLWCPFNKECNGRDPMDIFSFWVDCNAAEWVVYDGPLPDSEQYKAAVAEFDGCLTK
jgi:hypothetical protein